MEGSEAWRMEFDGHAPIYLQIIGNFSRALVRGDVKPGERIPSIRDMAVALKVNPNTVARAYQEMERERTIYSQRGTGYFIMNEEGIVERVRDATVREAVGRFLGEMRALGYGDGAIRARLDAAMRGEGEGAAGAAGAAARGEGEGGEAAWR
jgi:GntR family transcriptional regulator